MGAPARIIPIALLIFAAMMLLAGQWRATAFLVCVAAVIYIAQRLVE